MQEVQGTGIHLSLTLQALRDLADPAEGVYNATALLDERLKYIIGMLDKYQKVPGGPARVSNYLTAGVPIGSKEPKDAAEAEQSESSQAQTDGSESEQTIRDQLNALASNNAVSFEGVRRRIAMFITSDDL